MVSGILPVVGVPCHSPSQGLRTDCADGRVRVCDVTIHTHRKMLSKRHYGGAQCVKRLPANLLRRGRDSTTRGMYNDGGRQQTTVAPQPAV